VLVLERVGQRETLLWRVTDRLERTLLGAFAGAQAVAALPDELVVGGADGALVRLRPDGAVAERGALSEPVHALAPGPRLDRWWVLTGTAASSLVLVDAALAPLWSVRMDITARSFAPVEGQERVWLAAEDQLRGYGPGGKLEVARSLAGGPWEAWAATDDQVVLLGVGALLELSIDGTLIRERRSQGGFADLAALTRASSGRALTPRRRRPTRSNPPPASRRPAPPRGRVPASL
jgi:hypothetical protein